MIRCSSALFSVSILAACSEKKRSMVAMSQVQRGTGCMLIASRLEESNVKQINNVQFSDIAVKYVRVNDVKIVM